MGEKTPEEQRLIRYIEAQVRELDGLKVENESLQSKLSEAREALENLQQTWRGTEEHAPSETVGKGIIGCMANDLTRIIDALKGGRMKNQRNPRKEPCPKCGCRRIHVRYKNTYGTESLQHTCHGCRYSWETETLDKAIIESIDKAIIESMKVKE